MRREHRVLQRVFGILARAGGQPGKAVQLALVALDSADQWAEIILGLRLHPWQREILDDLSHLRPRKQVAVRAPNGAGKDAMIIAPLALWWIRRFPRGRVVITSKESRQPRPTRNDR